jgi:hypothetical protein
MFKFRAVLIVLLLMRYETESFKTNDICSINSAYMSRLGCSPVKPYRCNEYYCARNRLTCVELSANYRAVIDNTYKSKIENSDLAQLIEPCTPHTNLCLNMYMCTKKKNKSSKGMSRPEARYCACNNKNSVVCQNKYCADSKLSCDQFIQFSGTESDVKICG